ncbi:MAG: hypothetical protein AAGU27_29090 [Dehalobacterium sp.]
MIDNNKLPNIITEIESRIEQMEDAAYDSGPRLNKQDFIGSIFIAIICIVGIFFGY